jgi:hypothetical protein
VKTWFQTFAFTGNLYRYIMVPGSVGLGFISAGSLCTVRWARPKEWTLSLGFVIRFRLEEKMGKMKSQSFTFNVSGTVGFQDCT